MKRRAIVFAVSALGSYGLWVALRWQAIPGATDSLRELPFWGKGLFLGSATLALFGMFRLGGKLLREARSVYVVSTGARSSQTEVRWYRYLNPVGPLVNIYVHRDLLWQLVRREIQARYRGSFLGIVWSVITPLLMLAIYTFAFSVVLQARWHSEKQETLGEFAVTLFAGLIAFNIFSECVNRAPTLVITSPNYVKKVVFPLEILPVSVLASALFHGLISTVILLVGGFLLAGTISPAVVLVPLATLPLIGLCLGLGWFLASFGVYVRDVAHAVGLFVQALFFLTPIFYPVEAVPEVLRPILWLNPLCEVVDSFRRSLVWNQMFDWTAWLAVTAISSIVFLLGYTWFMKTKAGFADVI